MDKGDASNPSGGEDKADVGASYANAVQNFKNNPTPGSSSEPPKTKEESQVPSASQGATEKPSQAEPEVLDDDGSFTPVVSHSRKERKNEKKKQKQLQNGSDKHHDKKETHGVKRDRREEREDKDKETKSPEEQTGDKKVFVAAPLPKVNPWKKRSVPAAVGGAGASNSRGGGVAVQAAGPSGLNFEHHPMKPPGPPPKQVTVAEKWQKNNENKRQKTNPTPTPAPTANAPVTPRVTPISVSIIKLYYGWFKLF